MIHIDLRLDRVVRHPAHLWVAFLEILERGRGKCRHHHTAQINAGSGECRHNFVGLFGLVALPILEIDPELRNRLHDRKRLIKPHDPLHAGFPAL